MYGWLMVISLSLHITFNLYFIFRHILKIIKLVFLKFYNYVNFLIDKYKFVNDNDKNIEKET
jgi:hypothetical protein